MSYGERYGIKDQSAYLFASQRNTTKLLISKLAKYRSRNSCVVAVSNNALEMAIEVAGELGADLFFLPSRKIEDPAGSTSSIGIVSFDFVLTYNSCRDIPQDYVYRQAQRLRSELFSSYPGVYAPIHRKFQDRIVILVDDLVQSSESILALLDAIQRQRPQEVVVAVPIISESAVHSIESETASMVFVQTIFEDSIDSTYGNFIALTDREATALFTSSNVGSNYGHRLLLNAVSDHNAEGSYRYQGDHVTNVPPCKGCRSSLRSLIVGEIVH